jgi:hypothetical protein
MRAAPRDDHSADSDEIDARDLPRLIFQLAPHANESLLGFAARAARLSEVRHLADVLGFAGIRTARPATAPWNAQAAGALAHVLRLPSSEVARRMYPQAEVDGRR